MSELRLFIPIGKVDEAARTVYGTLTEEIADKSGEMFDYASGKPAVQAWSDGIKAASKGKSLGNVRAMHDSIAAGKFTDIVYDDDKKRIEGAAKIVDDGEWEKVLAGVYTGFSIGGSYTRRWQDPENPSLWRFTPKLSEISLVDNPCVPTATFEYIKADGSVEMRKFITPSHKEDSMDPKLLADAREALAKGTATDEQKALVITADAELLKAAQDAIAKGDATDEQKALAKAAADAEAAKVALVKDGKAVKPKAAPVQKWLADDGEAFDTKREAEVHNLHLEKQAELAPGLAQMDALLKGAKKPAAEEDDEDKEGDDEDTKKAKKARRDAKAKKDDDAEMAAKAASSNVAVTISAIDAKTGAEFLKSNTAKIATAIAEQQKNFTSPIEHVAKSAAALAGKVAPVKKSLYQIGWMADLLSNLQGIKSDVEWEQMWEQDSASELPAKFKSLVAEMCQVLVALVGEETKELIEEGGGEVEILAMAAKVDAAHAAPLAKFISEMTPYEEADLQKPEVKANVQKFIALKAELEKAGARHSKSDKESLMALHKSASDHVDAMEKCFKGMGIMDDDTDDKDAKKMSKLIDALTSKSDEVLAVSKVCAAQNETLLKAIPLIEGLQTKIGDLEKQKSELASRMEHLEKQPAAPKGHVRAVSKTQDGGATGETEAEYKAKLAKMSPSERARAEMKKAMSNPQEMPSL